MDVHSVTIRELDVDDVDDAVRVINAAARWYAEILPADEVPNPEMTPEQWRDEHQRMTFYGADVDGELVGVIGLEYIADVALLRHWYVDPRAQRRGVGTLLREYAEQQVVGVDRVIAGTYAANVKARSALEAAGYELSADSDAVLVAFYDLPQQRRASSVTYERAIPPTASNADRTDGADPLEAGTEGSATARDPGEDGQPLVLEHATPVDRATSPDSGSASDRAASLGPEVGLAPPTFPVGYHRFHRSRFLNYQLNRFHSLGYLRYDDIVEVAERIRRVSDWGREFTRLASAAESDGRLANAAFAYRAAEFLISPGDPRKLETYDRFADLFERAFAGSGFERAQVPFRGGALEVLRLSAADSPNRGSPRRTSHDAPQHASRGALQGTSHGALRDGQHDTPKQATTNAPLGTILVHGGFDSLIEEFLAILLALAHGGYDVVAFEGPGQGAALRQHGLTFDHDWEKPTAAILDHLGLSGVTLLGISMGGYWCLRAAAFEPRIERVIVMASVYDWLAQLPAPARPLVRGLVRRRRLMNATIRLRMRMFPVLRHAIEQCLMQIEGDEPIDAVDWLLAMNGEHQQPGRVTQDVLLMHGMKDRFQPVSLHRAQRDALTNARSVTERLFTEEEHAASHCQMGNLGLAVDVMLEWLNAHPAREARPAD